MFWSALGSWKPQPVLPFWNSAPIPEQMPAATPLKDVAPPAQHPSWQSASLTHPPVVNCPPCPLPTLDAPAAFGVSAEAMVATIRC